MSVHEISGKLKKKMEKEAKTGKKYISVLIEDCVVDKTKVDEQWLNAFETVALEELNEGDLVAGMFERNTSGDKTFQNLKELHKSDSPSGQTTVSTNNINGAIVGMISNQTIQIMLEREKTKDLKFGTKEWKEDWSAVFNVLWELNNAKRKELENE